MAKTRPFFEFQVGSRTVRCSIEKVHGAMSAVQFEWEPDVPAALDVLSHQELAEYESGRADATVRFFAELVKRQAH